MSHDPLQATAPHPTGSPWSSLAAAFMVAALLAGGLVWQARQDLGVVHGATRFHAIDATLATSGRLLPGAPEQLKAAGYQVIIDLRTPTESGVAEAQQAAEAAGLRWLNVPVTGTPDAAQFVAVSAVLTAERPNKLLVHCSSNKRASAMVMLHRVTREGVSLADARRDMDVVWQPRKGWNDYIAGVLANPPPAPAIPTPTATPIVEPTK